MKRAKKRRIRSFEPCGPIQAIIDNELRSGGAGALRRYMEECVMAKSGLKYPKLAQRFLVLREEAA